MNWQPIETAPRDWKTRVLVTDGARVLFVCLSDNGSIAEACFDCAYAADGYGDGLFLTDDEKAKLTHWMPLPNPPK